VVARYLSVVSLVLLLSLDSCFLFPDTKEVLPPATQTGENTLGFLLNGQLWLPKGMVGFSDHLSPYYDPDFDGRPVLNTTAYRVLSNSEVLYFAFGIDGIYREGSYEVKFGGPAVGSFIDSKCKYFWNDSTVYQKGTIVITKLALPIISGTFDFVLSKSGCDTVKITKGRFDFKFQ